MSATDTSAAAVKPNRITDQPWWTPADQAEVEALWGEWVDGWVTYHKDRCLACLAHEAIYGKQWCTALTAALEVVLEFREQRIRVSKAQWLRLTNDAMQP